MKMIIQAFGKDSEKFSNLLRKIADKIEDGKMGECSFQEELCYDYVIEDETYYRKFMIYSNDHVNAQKKESKILGMSFGKDHHDAFENFHIKDDSKNIVVREIIGEPIYKIVGNKKVY